MKLTRTYPQPDSDLPHIGPRERAMAVFKYLLNLEPEAAVQHPLFECIVHSYEQSENRGAVISEGWGDDFEAELRRSLTPSLVPMLSSEQAVELRAHPYFDGKL